LPTVKSSSDICHHLQWHIDTWDAWKHTMLVQVTEHDMDYFLTTHKMVPPSWSAQQHLTFHCKVICSKVHAAVWHLLATKGGVLFPDDVDPLTRSTVAEVLASKHPAPHTPSPTSLPTYPSTPADFIIWTLLQIILNVLPTGSSMMLQMWECQCSCSLLLAL